MGIYERPRKKGQSTFQVKIQRNGLPRIGRTFTNREEAEIWEGEMVAILESTKGRQSILLLLKSLSDETGKAPDVIMEEALGLYARSVSVLESTTPIAHASTNPKDDGTTVQHDNATTIAPLLCEILNAEQLKRRMSQLERIVGSISPSIAYREPTEKEYPIMVETIQHYEKLLFRSQHALVAGSSRIYSSDDTDQEEPISKEQLALLLRVPVRDLDLKIASCQIPLPGTKILPEAATGPRKRGRPRKSGGGAISAWTTMQVAAILAGHGSWLANNDQSQNWYRYLIAETELTLMMMAPT